MLLGNCFDLITNHKGKYSLHETIDKPTTQVGGHNLGSFISHLNLTR